MLPLELTEPEIAALRRSVSTAHHHHSFTGPVTWVMYVDGPLAGIRVPLDAAAARSWCVAWCIVREGGRVAGPVQVTYGQGPPDPASFPETGDNNPRELRFRAVQAGVR